MSSVHTVKKKRTPKTKSPKNTSDSRHHHPSSPLTIDIDVQTLIISGDSTSWRKRYIMEGALMDIPFFFPRICPEGNNSRDLSHKRRK
ncbi:hypothetical protein CEXT_419521 [Caerostris extrusa]|uniref:Uncharacterized protein n=1 Tax=Caerostris extrusa TaxID=172846 RepID=A0AAV4NAL1_CAEEX|nr:hypothetical protein CEXT_419521 [Caerostris extrusa]